MKQRFTKLLAAVALLVFMMPSLVAWGQTRDKITSISNITTNTSYYIGATNSNTDYYLQLPSTTGGKGTAVTSTDDASVFIFEAVSGKTNVYTIKIAGTDNYLATLTSSNATLTFGTTAAEYTASNQTNKIRLSNNSRSIQKNNSGTQFGSYGNTQTDIWLMEVVAVSPLASIAISGTYPTVFHVGDAFTHEGAIITATYEDLSTKDVTEDATFSAPDMSTIGVKEVTVSYTENEVTKTTTYDITVNAPATLTSITLSGTYPTEFTQFDAFSSEGIVVTAHYDDNTTSDVTADATFSGYDMSTVGQQTVTVSYEDKTATYSIIVNEYVQPTEFDIALNNEAFGCGTGNNGTEQSFTINNTVVVAGCSSSASSKTYYDTDHVRFYAGSYLKITAPTGYNITKTVFTANGTWNGSISVNVGTYNNDTKTWEGSTSQLDFSFAAQNRISSIAITLAVPGVEYDITYEMNLTNGSFASGNPTSASAETTVTVATTPNPGYHLATLTYNDGTNTVSATVSGNSGSFLMPEHDVTVSATFAENTAIFTEGVYNEPMTTQVSFDNMTVIDNVGDQTWQFDSQYKYAKINGYANSTNNANEDWLITPQMAVNNGKLDIAFETYHNSYGSGQLSVKWATSLNGTWNDAEFSEGAASSWTSSDLTISTDASDVYVAFVYESTSSAAGTWEVKNFTAKQYYNITNGNPSNGSIEIEPSDKQVVGGMVLVDATANEGYHFTSWSMTPSSITVSEDAFTMPAENVTVSAVFEQDVYYTITYNENGTTNTYEVLGGSIGSNLLDSPVSDIPANLTFVGWSTSQISTYATTQPELVDATYNVTGDVTFYAVYKYDYSYTEGGGAPTWTKVTDASTLSAGDQLVITSDDNATEKVAGDISNKVMTEVAAEFGNGVMISLPNDAVILTLGGTTGAWTLANSSNQLLGATAAKNLAWGSGTTTWSISISDGDATIQNGTSTYGRFLHNVSSTRFTTYTSNASSSMLLPQLYRLEGGSTTVSGTYYLCLVTEQETDEITTSTTWAGNNTIKTDEIVEVSNGATLTVEGLLINPDVNALWIDNGGQLIANNAVNATVQKEIVGFGSDNSVKTGWYTIASPLTTTVAPASNMLANTYDLYYYDEADFMWYNYKPNNAHSGFSIEPYKGYLYANSENTTLSFSGVMRASNVNVSNSLSYASSNENVKGFNLVGNPFTYNLTSSSNITIGGNNFSAYYIADGTVNTDGDNLIAYTVADRPIKPGEGFFVQATAADQSLVFNGRGRGEQNGYIRILAGNESFIDRAYVQFGGGNTLRKMTLSDNTAKVYVMQDNKDYAAMIIEEGQIEIPVNFKAAANGNYTITVNAEGVEMNYLHLIDNMTGMDVDLLQTPSYTFDATTNDYTSRFRLVFSANGTTGNEAETFAFFSNGNWVIGNEGEATLQVIDVNGRIVSNETINGSVATSIVATPGVYMLRLVNGNEVKTQKIVVR